MAKRKKKMSGVRKVVKSLSKMGSGGKRMSRMQSLFVVGVGPKTRTKVRYY